VSVEEVERPVEDEGKSIMLIRLFIEMLKLMFDSDSNNSSKGRSTDI